MISLAVTRKRQVPHLIRAQRNAATRPSPRKRRVGPPINPAGSPRSSADRVKQTAADRVQVSGTAHLAPGERAALDAPGRSAPHRQIFDLRRLSLGLPLTLGFPRVLASFLRHYRLLSSRRAGVAF